MKKAVLKLVLIMVLTFSFVKVQAQTVHELILNVDTTKQDKVANSSFTKGSNTAIIENSSSTKFGILAEVGDTVLWKAVSSTEPQVPVKITGVTYLGGPRIFSANNLSGTEMVKATIIRGGKNLYVYKLSFKVGSDATEYTLTSKIKIKP